MNNNITISSLKLNTITNEIEKLDNEVQNMLTTLKENKTNIPEDNYLQIFNVIKDILLKRRLSRNKIKSFEISDYYVRCESIMDFIIENNITLPSNIIIDNDKFKGAGSLVNRKLDLFNIMEELNSIDSNIAKLFILALIDIEERLDKSNPIRRSFMALCSNNKTIIKSEEELFYFFDNINLDSDNKY